MTCQRFLASLSALLLAALALFIAPAASAAVDANRASQAELETVKGIGPGLSGKILAAREKGAFRDWTDLQERVSGIGARNAVKFSGAGLTVAGAGYAGSGEAAAPAAARTAKAGKSEKGEKGERAVKAEKAEKAGRSAARE